MSSLALVLTVFTASALAVPTNKPLHARWDNGLAQTPPMGWNSYNHYSCSPNESIIMSNAQALVDLGLKDLGYNYATTDCGWTIPTRTENGTITWNATLFPNGFPAMGQFIHSLGLKFGVYSDSGVQMCMTGGVNQTGSLYYEQTDADTFSAWGADLLKYDNCYSEAAKGFPNTDYSPTVPLAPRFATMQQALINTGRSILYQICEWGLDFPSAWAPELGNTWRVTNDIIPAWRTIYRIVNQVVPQTSFAGPHHWLDLDMLEVGNDVFTIPEEQTHFTLWAILKSPLVIGAALNDTLTSINAESLAILKNKNVISYNQDSLGVSASLSRRWTEEGYDVWSGPLGGGRTIVALVNWNNSTLDATLDLPDVGLQSAGYVKDIWNNVTTENVLTSYKKSVAPHGTLLLELGDTTPAGYYTADEPAHDSSHTSTTTFSNVYGRTSSSSYTLTITLSCPSKHSFSIELSSTATNASTTHVVAAGTDLISLPLTLLASNNNTLTISSPEKSVSISITPPTPTFYPATAFDVTGTATHVTCPSNLCLPVGAKIGSISPSGSASISIPNNSSSASTAERYVELTYTNNEVSLDTSWTNGTNARNLTISVNGFVTRLEVPLSGRSSELFSPMKGWGDSATLGVLTEGWGKGGQGADVVVVGNEGGEDGVQSWGADFVGVSAF